MIYELYADSLFMINFVMNLYLLWLVNRDSLRTATRKRMILGALIGASAYLLSFLIPVTGNIKWPAALVIGMILMIRFTFCPKGFGAYPIFIGKLLYHTFLVGGIFLFLYERIAALQVRFVRNTPFFTLALFAAVLFLYGVLSNRDMNCRVTLINGERELTLDGIIDSGNSLREPVSGEPVCVIGRNHFGSLWEEGDLFRVIPYHSIGKKNGILRGYRLPRMELEYAGAVKRFQDVYIAVSEEEEREILIHPGLLKQG